MRVLLFPGMSGGSAVNTDTTFETLGTGSDLKGVPVTSGPSNTAGSYTLIGTTSAAWSGFWITCQNPQATGNRFLVSVSLDNGSTTALANLYMQPGTGNGSATYFVPLQVASGAVVKAKTQCQTATQACNILMTGLLSGTNTPPGFATATQLVTVDTNTTRASSTDIAVVTNSTTWTPLVPSTSTDYGAFLVVVSDSASGAPTWAEYIRARLGVGAPSSEVSAIGISGATATSAAMLPRASIPLLQRSLPANTRLSMNIQGGTGGYNLCPQVIGFR